ncbi:MAG TPA: histidine phosphatase family protein [Candidatus Binatia bacterium]|nr:histidine phosphatase family protein [Candidatus Binatia bacterium]
MAGKAQKIYLLRHGETEWSRSGRHTGTTDLPLTENGRAAARALRPALAAQSFDLVLTSPLRRARETCELAGLGPRAEIDADLCEWNYVEYEGRTSAEIQAQRPGWVIFRDGCPGGEAPGEVAARADRVIARVRAVQGNVVLFAHGHILRVFVSRWVGLPARAGENFLLDTSTLSVLGYYGEAPAVQTWNAPARGGTISTAG